MKIIKLKPQGVFAVNSYLVISEKNNAVLIDTPENGETVLAEVEKQGAKLNKILLTHGHCDHIESVAEIAEKTGASTATISRVNRSLNYGCDGYDLIFERMGIDLSADTE